MDKAMLDAAVVGAGPIGIEMAAALKKEGLNYVHLEQGRLAETIFRYPPDTRFFSSPERIAIAGIPFLTLDQSKGTREEYLAYLRAVTMQLDLNIRLFERLVTAKRGPDGFTLESEHVLRLTRNEFKARRVILAAGDMHNPRRPQVPGEDMPHVHRVLQDPHTYFGARVLIVGGKNSAAEAAIRLHRAGSRVTLCHRGLELPEKSIKYWIFPELKSLIRSGSIRFFAGSRVTEISRQSVKIDTQQGSLEEDFDFVLLLIGYESDPSLYEACGIEMEPHTHRPSWNAQTMESSVPGIYIAGTGAAGTQKPYELFIENCHEHVDRIMNAITGRSQTVFRKFFDLPES